MLPVVDLTEIALVSGLLFVALHYIPWTQLWGGAIKPPWTYVWGIVGLSACYTLLLVWWQVDSRVYPPWVYLLAWGLIVAAGGGAVIGCYILDGKLEMWACTKDEGAKREMEEGWGNEQQQERTVEQSRL